MAAILATGRAPVFAQAQAKKMDAALILAPPDVGAVGRLQRARRTTAGLSGPRSTTARMFL